MLFRSPAELEGFVTEQELGSEEVEQVTRELEAMGMEIGAPIDTEEEKAKEAAEAAVWASESLSGAADSLQLFLADVGRHASEAEDERTDAVVR